MYISILQAIGGGDPGSSLHVDPLSRETKRRCLDCSGVPCVVLSCSKVPLSSTTMLLHPGFFTPSPQCFRARRPQVDFCQGQGLQLVEPTTKEKDSLNRHWFKWARHGHEQGKYGMLSLMLPCLPLARLCAACPSTASLLCCPPLSFNSHAELHILYRYCCNCY